MAGYHDFKEKFYGRRKGPTLSQRQRRLLRDILPSVSFQAESIPRGALSPETLFDFQVKDVWLEIGFGKGEHLSFQAGQNSDIGFIGCEPFINGVAGLVTKIHESGCKNIRIYPDDARHVLSALKPASIGRLFLLHPDPWPKARHAKRRFVSENNLDVLSRIMKPGAELRIGTDHPTYMAWTMKEMQKRRDFIWTAECADDWRNPPPDWPETRYAAKAKASSTPCVYLTFLKTERDCHGPRTS